MKVTVPLIQVMVRRDANTTTRVTVAPHELTLLRQMFGKEHVNGDQVVGTVELDPQNEAERLSNKYGAPKVVKVYGDDGGERLAELVQRAAVKDKPAAKTAAETPVPKGAAAKAAAAKASEQDAAEGAGAGAGNGDSAK